MISYEIPDPFATFVEEKYFGSKAMRYDFFAREWTGACYSCNEELYAPNKKAYIKNRLHHTRNECTGGY